MSEQIWEGIVETDRLIRYFHKLSVKHRKRHQITAWGLAVFATGSAGTMIARLPEWSSAILFLIVACVAIASLMLNDSAKSTAARMIADQFQLLGREWRQLWYGECTQEQIETLWAKFYHIPAGVDIGYDRKLNQEAQDEGMEVLPMEFGNYQEANPGIGAASGAGA